MKPFSFQKLKRCIISSLSDDLLNSQWRQLKAQLTEACHPTFGHCYIAAEAAYHLLGGKPAGWKPYCLRCGGGATHWFIRHTSGRIFDPTSGQFEGEPIAYPRAVGMGFLTKRPSKRARVVMQRVSLKINAP